MKKSNKVSALTILIGMLTLNFSENAYCQNLNLENDSAFRASLIGIVVSDVKISAAWYSENFGFTISREMDFPEYDSLKIVFMRLGEVELELIQKSTSFSIKKYVPDYDGFDKSPLIGFSKVAFRISNADALAAELKKKGVKFLVNPYDDSEFGIRSFIIADRDGNVLQFEETLHK
jgi:catechol 2,3-dioxygenase-like lactoylglutathione lyase family enzyme